MTRTRIHLGEVGWCLVMALTSMVCSGCASKPKTPPKPPTVKTLRVTNQMGGAHYRTIVHNGVWYQTFNTQLVMVNTEEAGAIQEVPLGNPGEIGPAIDMAIDSSINRMYIVIEDDQVIELSLEAPPYPKIVSRMFAKDLGIRPRRLSTVDDQCYVSGPGGAIRLRDRKRIVTAAEDVGRISQSVHGLVACIGRQVRTVEDNRYIGSASDLVAIPGSADRAGHPMLVFTLQSDDVGMVGLMTPDIRELPSQGSKLAFEGTIRRVRLIDGDLWVVTDVAVMRYSIEGEKFVEKARIDVLGACDVDRINARDVAIAGTAGRSIYRFDSDLRQSGAFLRSHREPGYLVEAASDGQHILAGSREGLWQYLINSRIELTRRQFDTPPPPSPRRAATIHATAAISADGTSITITPTASFAGTGAQPYSHAEPYAAIMRTVVAVDGDFWIGHDRGITVLRAPVAIASDSDEKDGAIAADTGPVIGRVRIPGAVFHVRPLLIGGGVSFASEFGGFGVCELVEEPIGAAPDPGARE